MKNKFREILLNAQAVILRYPLVLLASAIMAFVAICLIEDVDENFTLFKILIVSSIGISLMFALKIFSQRFGNKYLAEIAGVLFLIGFYFLLPGKEDDFTEFYVFLLIPVYIMSHLLVSFIGFIQRKFPENNFWQYNKNLFVNFFLTLVFTGVLTGGVLLAILAVDNLFNVGFKENLYGQILVSLLIFGSTFIFLLFNETGLDFLEKDGKYPVVLKFFTQYVLIPLLCIYVVILYFYSGKILINWELPRGWVSYLVLAYSVVGILALLLVHPLKENTDKSWIRIFSKVFYFTLIPLIVLLFIAIFTRVLEYGYTEPRYFVLLLAVWLSTVVFYFIFRKNPTIKFIPISLFCFGLFALIFPYFNPFSVAKRSQKNELEKILTDHHLLVNGKIDFKKEVPDTVVSEIDNKFNYLHDRFQKEYLFGFLDKSTQREFEETKYWSFYSKFTNKKVTPIHNTGDYVNLNLVSDGEVSSIKDYQYMVTNQDLTHNSIRINQDSLHLNFHNSTKEKRYILKLNDKDSIDLLPKIDKLLEQYKGANNYKKVEKLFVEDDLGKYHIKVYFRSINKAKYGDDQPTYWFDGQIILLKENL